MNKLQNYINEHHSKNDLPLFARSTGIPLRRFKEIISGEIHPSASEMALIAGELQAEPDRLF